MPLFHMSISLKKKRKYFIHIYYITSGLHVLRDSLSDKTKILAPKDRSGIKEKTAGTLGVLTQLRNYYIKGKIDFY